MLNSAGWFRERVRALWREKYPALLADAEEISRLSQAYEEEFARNYEKWDLLGKKLLFHQHDSVTSYTSQADAARFLSSWLKNRLEWLNSEWGEEAAAEAVDFTSLDLTKHYDAAVLGAYHCCEGVRTESGYVFTVTDPHDPIFRFCIPEARSPFPRTSIAILKSPVWRRRKILWTAIRRSSFSPPEKRAPRKRGNPFTPPFRRMEAGIRSYWIFRRRTSGQAQSIRSGLIFR